MTNTNQQKQPLRDDINLAKVLQALSDPIRLEMVLKLANESEIQCGCFDLDIPKSSLSHHFKVLRESGIVTTRREGKELFNSLRIEDLEARFPGVLSAVINSARKADIGKK